MSRGLLFSCRLLAFCVNCEICDDGRGDEEEEGEEEEQEGVVNGGMPTPASDAEVCTTAAAAAGVIIVVVAVAVAVVGPANGASAEGCLVIAGDDGVSWEGTCAGEEDIFGAVVKEVLDWCGSACCAHCIHTLFIRFIGIHMCCTWTEESAIKAMVCELKS